MKLEEVKKLKAPQDGDHPIMYDLIRSWLDQGKHVIIDSDGYIMVAKSLVVDFQDDDFPVHGQQRSYRLTYRGSVIPRGSKTPVLSDNLGDTWMYPAELEDAKVVQNDSETVKIWMPDYLNDPHLMKDRK